MMTSPCGPDARDVPVAETAYARAIKELQCPRCAETRQVEVTQYLLRLEAFCNTCSHTWKLG